MGNSRNRNRNASQNVPADVVVADPDGHLTTADPASQVVADIAATAEPTAEPFAAVVDAMRAAGATDAAIAATVKRLTGTARVVVAPPTTAETVTALGAAIVTLVAFGDIGTVPPAVTKLISAARIAAPIDGTDYAAVLARSDVPGIGTRRRASAGSGGSKTPVVGRNPELLNGITLAEPGGAKLRRGSNGALTLTMADGTKRTTNNNGRPLSMSSAGGLASSANGRTNSVDGWTFWIAADGRNACQIARGVAAG